MKSLLVRGGEVFTPDPLGKKDVLVFGRTIHSICDDIPEEALRRIDAGLDVIDAHGCCVVPGLVDQHIHINGAGGEGGPEYRTPPVTAGTLFRAGITSVVGMLGTDGAGRSLQELLMKALGLDREGVSAWILTGAYQLPGPTITGSILGDMMFIEKVIGAKMAVSDHRGSHPTPETLRWTISEARRGGILSGKGGVSVVHMGEERTGLRPLYEALKETDIPPSQVLPTHCGRSAALLDEAVEWALRGGCLDITTSGGGSRTGTSLAAPDAVGRCLEAGVPVERISMSTDGNGSLPSFNERMEFIGMGVGNPASLHEMTAELALRRGLPLEHALALCTRNPAKRMRLHGKGELKAGADADILILGRDSLDIRTVVSRGETVVLDGKLLRGGTFERE